jgi:hypothetical protein
MEISPDHVVGVEVGVGYAIDEGRRLLIENVVDAEGEIEFPGAPSGVEVMIENARGSAER